MKKLYLVVLSLLTIFLVACNQIPSQDDPIPTVKYDLTFMVDQTTVYHVFKVELGSPMQYPADPVKEGYIFTGWYAGEVEFEGDVVTATALTLYAHFVPDTPIVTTYTVTFYDGEELYYSTQVERGKTVTDVIDTTREHYTFDGWFIDQTLENNYGLYNPIYENTVLYGKWDPIYYDVTLYRGSNIFSTTTIQSGHGLTAIDTNIEGYSFIGWYVDSMLSTPYNNEPITSNITLYGKWSSESIKITYYRGTDVFATRNVNAGEVAPIIDTQVTGYEFDAWYIDALLVTKYTSTVLYEDTSLYGKWIISTTPNPDDNYTGYYSSINGLTGTALTNQLYTLLNDTGQYVTTTYGAARDILEVSDVWVGFNTNYLYLIYSDKLGNSNYALPVWDGGATWNREHVWAKSLFGTKNYDPNNSTRGIDADIHNLRASDTNINSTRGNNLFTNQVYVAAGYGNYSGKWYPGDNHRGDVARIIFYMDVRWGNMTALSDIGTLSTLLAWHETDPVDAFEINRNNIIYGYQKNRNPFIDHPELVDKIYA